MKPKFLYNSKMGCFQLIPKHELLDHDIYIEALNEWLEDDVVYKVFITEKNSILAEYLSNVVPYYTKENNLNKRDMFVYLYLEEVEELYNYLRKIEHIKTLKLISFDDVFCEVLLIVKDEIVIKYLGGLRIVTPNEIFLPDINDGRWEVAPDIFIDVEHETTLKMLGQITGWHERKIDAIRLIREIFKLGLKDAKEVYEHLLYSGFWEYRKDTMFRGVK